jgi:hypothetical protein
MGYGSKHKTDFSWFSEDKAHFLNKVFFRPGRESGYGIEILPEGKPAKVSK